MKKSDSKRRKRGLLTFVVIILLVVLGVLAAYYRFMKKQQVPKTERTPTTETEKLVAKDLEMGYPETPKEVMKLFGRINQCIYNKNLSDEDFSSLVEKLRTLYCKELKELNKQEKMETAIRDEKKKYQSKKRKNINYNIDDERNYKYQEIDGVEMVDLRFSYFIRSGNDYNTVNWYAILIKEDDKWKIREFNPLGTEEGDSAEGKK